jgi:hypothetical protein
MIVYSAFHLDNKMLSFHLDNKMLSLVFHRVLKATSFFRKKIAGYENFFCNDCCLHHYETTKIDILSFNVHFYVCLRNINWN